VKDIDYIIKNWPRHKQDEIYAVKRFLDNEMTRFELSPHNVEHNPDEPADIWVKDIDRKFQVVVADFPLYEALGKTKPDRNGVRFVEMPSRNKFEVIEEFVIKPLQKKNKYGNAANGIILLIKPPFDPPWVEDELDMQRRLGLNEELGKLGFEKIFLVYSDRNIQVFP
jgi:hypothetical protein